MRLRIPKPAPGTVWGIREAARLLTVDDSVVRYQLAHSKIARAGDGVDARSAWEWAQGYEPHKDNVQRRIRGKTLVAQAPAAPQQAGGAALGAASGGAGVQNHGQAAGSGLLRGQKLVAVGTAATARNGAQKTPVLDTREWVDRFYREQLVKFGGAFTAGTQGNYDMALGRFKAAFPLVPMQPVQGRQEIVNWIHGLRHLGTGKPLADGTKATIRNKIATFYHWLQRDHGFAVPDLEHTTLPGMSKSNKVVYPDEAQLVLAQTRDHTEYTLVVLFAQTTARLGELCSLRPECLHDHWAHSWDKRTEANPTGYRPLFLADESFDALRQEFSVYGELMLHGRPLAGKPYAVDDKGKPVPGGRVRLDDPHTYRVDAMPYAGDAVQEVMKRLMTQAGVYENGKLVHAFRRSFKAEWAKNGGNPEYSELVMGHFTKSDMAQLYFNDKNDEVAKLVRKFAPRRFLLPEKTEAAT